jgi:hypothetical protein
MGEDPSVLKIGREVGHKGMSGRATSRCLKAGRRPLDNCDSYNLFGDKCHAIEGKKTRNNSGSVNGAAE